MRKLLILLAGTLLPAAPALAQDLLNNGATLTLTGGAVLSVGGSLSNSSGTLDLSSGANQLYVGSNLLNASGATLTPGSASTVTLNGTAAQQLDLKGAGLANLTVNNTSGGVTLPANSNADVAGVLTLTSGTVTTHASATLRLLNGATLTGESSTRYVAGNLAAVKTSVPAAAATTFPNGLAITPAAALANLTVTRTAGLNTAQLSYGTNASSTHAGIDQIWRTSAPLTNAAVQLTWLSANDRGLTTFAGTQVWARAAAPVAGAGWARISASQNAAATRTATGTVPATTSFSFFTVGTADAPLPVTLVDFTAQAEGPAAVRLRWATATELNNASFTVERSLDGRTFAGIGTVAGAGSATTHHDYTLLDMKLPADAPVLYYRLRQVDLDGTFGYSPVRVVTLGGPATLVLFPNPTHGGPATLTGAIPGTVVRVFDALGRVVIQATAEADGTARLALPVGVATGVYAVRGGNQTLRLVVE
ncbi:T9SS type A sorting domain-containing protein [Hymenobacter negativus]|uniref:T9SS type A sorting domain-containing protein n=1 Tax=Hymenobacter negativus TaxID=2795026 RepID=A0ABS3QNC1_9BACT|nr:T9SS type A sorting domain-containing protein [Hymenobacter negativus]MBO2012784.1 T9SS type A sorting domain-containing protein [Hymenobacter negativus]